MEAADHLLLAFETVNPVAVVVLLFRQVRPETLAVQFIVCLRWQLRSHDVGQGREHIRQS